MGEQIRYWLKKRRVKHMIDRAVELESIINELERDDRELQSAKIAYEANPEHQSSRLRYYYWMNHNRSNLDFMAYLGVASTEGAKKELESVLNKLDGERIEEINRTISQHEKREKRQEEQALDDMAA